MYNPSVGYLQVCDRLAEAGFNVAMPDYFRGSPWSIANFPPPDGAAFMAWIGEHGFSEVIEPDMQAVAAHMREARGAQVLEDVLQ